MGSPLCLVAMWQVSRVARVRLKPDSTTREAADVKQPCCRQREHYAGGGQQRSDFELREQWSGRIQRCRQEQREREASRCGRGDHDQLAPADLAREMQSKTDED